MASFKYLALLALAATGAMAQGGSASGVAVATGVPTTFTSSGLSPTGSAGVSGIASNATASASSSKSTKTASSTDDSSSSTGTSTASSSTSSSSSAAAPGNQMLGGLSAVVGLGAAFALL